MQMHVYFLDNICLNKTYYNPNPNRTKQKTRRVENLIPCAVHKIFSCYWADSCWDDVNQTLCSMSPFGTLACRRRCRRRAPITKKNKISPLSGQTRRRRLCKNHFCLCKRTANPLLWFSISLSVRVSFQYYWYVFGNINGGGGGGGRKVLHR